MSTLSTTDITDVGHGKTLFLLHLSIILKCSAIEIRRLISKSNGVTYLTMFFSMQ